MVFSGIKGGVLNNIVGRIAQDVGPNFGRHCGIPEYTAPFLRKEMALCAREEGGVGLGRPDGWGP